MNNIKNIIFSIIIISILTSCNPEKKLAMDFAGKAGNYNILVLEPQSLFKTNLKTYLLDSLEISDNQNRDSALLENSVYLSTLNDSLFLVNYMLGYKKSLSHFGLNVFDADAADRFLSLDSNTFQVNIAQLELEETIYTFRDEALYYDKLYYHDHNLNAIYVNSWFEYSELDTDSSAQDVYFSTDLITDIPDGFFEYDVFKGKVKYLYNIDSLEQDMLYEFAYHIGSEYAKYTFDLMLNNELNRKVNPDLRSKNYWRYDPQRHTFFPALDDRFVPLD